MRETPVQLRWHQRIALTLYQVCFPLGLLLFVAVFPVWIFSRKRRQTIFKRLGWQEYPQSPRPSLKPVWIHALSIGELLSAGSLIEEVRRAIGKRPTYVSVSTLSAFAIASERFNRFYDSLFYLPFDVPFAVKRCLNKVNPDLFVLIETDIWPGFLSELRERRIPCLLINGRLSPRSFRNYNFFRILFEPAFNTFRWVYPQSSGEAERFLAIGLEPAKVRITGNLKFDVALSVPAEDALAELRSEFNIPQGSRVLIAGSTHPGEEDMIRSCFLRLRAKFPSLQLILVPRRPERGRELLHLFRHDGFHITLLSEPSCSNPVVLIGDRLGYLSRLYALAEIAIVGGSFVPKGGQNPIEPAACGKPVVFGPDMQDFPDVSRWLLDAKGAVQARDEDDLFATCERLLADPQEARMMGDRARRVVTDNRGTTVKIVQDIRNVVGSPPLPS
jgi:3-deoxy-D-manno-octulosonic-acid transferase